MRQGGEEEEEGRQARRHEDRYVGTRTYREACREGGERKEGRRERSKKTEEG